MLAANLVTGLPQLFADIRTNWTVESIQKATGKNISKIHGTAQNLDGVVYFAMYHPAAALHQASLRSAVEADMLKLKAVLAEAPKVNQAEPPPQQLSMF